MGLVGPLGLFPPKLPPGLFPPKFPPGFPPKFPPGRPPWNLPPGPPGLPPKPPAGFGLGPLGFFVNLSIGNKSSGFMKRTWPGLKPSALTP